MEKKNRLINLICIFIIIQPIFDIIVYFLKEVFEFNSLLISAIRPTFALAIYLCLILTNKITRTDKKKTYIYMLIYVIYSFMHLLNVKNYFFENSAGSFFHEIRYLLNYGYYLLQLINFYLIFKNSTEKEKKSIILSIVYATCLISFLHIISISTNTSAVTYPYSFTKQGWKGWSISAHYIGHSTLLNFPIIIYTIFEKKYIKKWYKYIILILSIVPGFYLVGSKAPLFGIQAIITFYALIWTVKILLKKEKPKKDFWLFILITIILLATFSKTNGYKNFNNQVEVYNRDNVSVKTQINTYVNEDSIIEEITKGTNKYKDNQESDDFKYRLNTAIIEFRNIDYSVFDNRVIQLKLNKYLRSISPLSDKLLGYGYHNMINCLWVETDTFSIYYCFGIVGFMLLIVIPIVYILIPGVFCIITYRKLNLKKLLLGFSVGLAIGLITVVGYTMVFAQTVFYLIMLMIIANDEFKKVDYKDKRKYLFMINDLNVGGAEVGLVDVVNELSKTETVDIVLLRKQGPLLKRLNSNIRVYSILNDNYSPLKNKINHIFYFMGGIFTRYVYSQTINTEYEVEISYIEGYPAVFIANSTNNKSLKMASIRVGLKKHKLSSDKIIGSKHIIKNAYEKMDKIYTVSKETTKEFVEKYPCCKEKTSTIYTYFNKKDLFAKSSEVLKGLYNPKKINFLAVGRFNYQKGYERLIEAFDKVYLESPNITLHIIGKNDTEIGQQLKKIIKEKGLEEHIKLHGIIENPYPYIKQCDAFISSSYYEGYPRVINEALALGKLCIGTNVTGTQEALESGRLGLLVEDSINGLIDGMNKVIKNKNAYKEYEQSIQSYDGNKNQFFKSFKELATPKQKMIIYMPKLSFGGMEKALVNLINNAELNNKYDLTLFLIYKGKNNLIEQLPSNIKMKLCCNGNWNYYNKIKATFMLLLQYISTIVNKYDISISYSYQHPVLNKLTLNSSNNNVIFIHSNIATNLTKKQVQQKIKKCRYAKFKKIICVSEDAKKELTSIMKQNKNIYVVNNLISGEEIIKLSQEKIQDFHFDQTRVNFINICRQEEDPKKISRIINATKKLNKEGKKFNVILVGDGKDHNYYKRIIKEENIKNIYLVGYQSNPYNYLNKSDALLISSIREGYPVVFIESMILNKPIITTNVSDANKEIKNKYGIVVENNEEDIYIGMKKFIEKGFKIQKTFDYQSYNKKIIAKIDDIFNLE